MSFTCITLLFITFANGFIIQENVIFKKINEVFINDDRWLITFVHDLAPYSQFIDKIKNDILQTDDIIKTITDFYQRNNLIGYTETFKSLKLELQLLTDTYQSVEDNFDQYKHMSSERNKRLLGPYT